MQMFASELTVTRFANTGLPRVIFSKRVHVYMSEKIVTSTKINLKSIYGLFDLILQFSKSFYWSIMPV